jgi:hypothetical protein
MNRIRSLVLLFAVAFFQLVPSLNAQQPVFEANVPFQFSAGDRTLPAGEYRITRNDAFIHIQNREDYSAALILTTTADSSSDGQVHLVFDRVNDLFFLRKVVAPAFTGSIELGVSGAEKKARADLRRLSIKTPPITITTAAATGAQ